MRKALVNGIGAAAIGGFVLFQSRNFSKGGASLADNPAVYPRILASILIGLGAILIVRTMAAGMARKPVAASTERTKGSFVSEGSARVAKVAACLIGFVGLTSLFGFAPASLLFGFGTPLALGTSRKTAILVSISLTATIYVVFFILFKVPVPRGILFG